MQTESSQTLPAIFTSFAVVYVYFSLTLGRIFPIQGKFCLTETKFFIGLVCIGILALSITMAAGICSISGFQESLLVAISVPFCVLIIGLDNIYIFFDTHDRTDPSLSVCSKK